MENHGLKLTKEDVVIILEALDCYSDVLKDDLEDIDLSLVSSFEMKKIKGFYKFNQMKVSIVVDKLLNNS